MGLYVTPIAPAAKSPPLIRRPLDQASRNEAQINKWWDCYPDANPAVVPSKSGLVVLDFDPRNGGRRGDFALPETLTVRSGGGDGGEHVYLQHPGSGKSVSRLPRGVDDKTNGYLLGPGSIHPETGQTYEWLDADCPVANCPSWLVANVDQSPDQGRATRSLPVIDVGKIPPQNYGIRPDEWRRFLRFAVRAVDDRSGRDFHLALLALELSIPFEAWALVVLNLPSSKARDRNDGYVDATWERARAIFIDPSIRGDSIIAWSSRLVTEISAVRSRQILRAIGSVALEHNRVRVLVPHRTIFERAQITDSAAIARAVRMAVEAGLLWVTHREGKKTDSYTLRLSLPNGPETGTDKTHTALRGLHPPDWRELRTSPVFSHGGPCGPAAGEIYMHLSGPMTSQEIFDTCNLRRSSGFDALAKLQRWGLVSKTGNTYEQTDLCLDRVSLLSGAQSRASTRKRRLDAEQASVQKFR